MKLRIVVAFSIVSWRVLAAGIYLLPGRSGRAEFAANSGTSIRRLRGRFHDYRGIRVLCTYHPAYLLRNPPAKKDCWQDMQILLARDGNQTATGET